MRSLSVAVTLGLLLVAASAVWVPIVTRPPCDSPDVEAAAVVAQDFLNAQHTHGYKYVLNRIEDIKIISTPSGDAYALEVDLLETYCHVLDPTPLANCSVRPKVLTAVEGDCDVVLKKVGGALSVTAFKCKTEESTEDLCLGCPTLLPLNHTSGLDFVHASLGTFNKQYNNTEFGIMEVGRMSSQLVSGGPIFAAEYVVIEAVCFGRDCIPLINAQQGFCVARGLDSDHTVDCKMFGLLPINEPAVGNGTVAPVVLPAIHGPHGLGHHQLTRIHDPELSGLLSAESAESHEVVPVVLGPPVIAVPADPAPAIEVLPEIKLVVSAESVDVPVVMADNHLSIVDPAPSVDVPSTDTDDVPTVDAADDDSTKAAVVKRETMLEPLMLAPTELPLPLVPLCPGRIRHY